MSKITAQEYIDGDYSERIDIRVWFCNRIVIWVDGQPDNLEAWFEGGDFAHIPSGKVLSVESRDYDNYRESAKTIIDKLNEVDLEKSLEYLRSQFTD
jgi:hypothetical protein